MLFALSQTVSGALRSVRSGLGLAPSAAAAATSSADKHNSTVATVQPQLSADVFFSLLKQRHSYYALSAGVGDGNSQVKVIDPQRIRHIVEQAVILTPSSFNSQPSRVAVLFGAEHARFWEITRATLRKIVPDDRWGGTETKMKQFAGAAGTVLFFTDLDVVASMERRVPTYADRFGTWATQSDAMLQFAVWVALASEPGLGANLQHYNPLVDEQVRETWKLPASWQLNAQLVFGVRSEEKGLKDQVPLETRVKVFGA